MNVLWSIQGHTDIIFWWHLCGRDEGGRREGWGGEGRGGKGRGGEGRGGKGKCRKELEFEILGLRKLKSGILNER